MVKRPYIVAIIPARGGSKSIPRKNIKLLGGVPLIVYSIIAGLKSRLIDRVIVSTDDEEIAAVAGQWGAEVPFLRPAELAQDAVTDLPVFKHAVGWLKANDREPDIVIQLRPTSPFRPTACVDEAIRLLLSDPAADSVRGITASGQNPFKMWQIEDGRMVPLLKTNFREPYNMPRQELPDTFWQTGHIEVIRTKTIVEKDSMTGDRILPYFLDPVYAVDLDTLNQWQYAEYLIQDQSLDMVRPHPANTDLWKQIRLVIFDFDGVMTDDRVWIDQDGVESVACSREDGMGVALLKRLNIPMIVVSTEENPVVSARCKKLNVPVIQGCGNKEEALDKIAWEHQIRPDQIAFLGNDINDIPAMQKAGLPVAVGNAHPEVKRRARHILFNQGGRGAIREFCEKLIQAKAGDEYARKSEDQRSVDRSG